MVLRNKVEFDVWFGVGDVDAMSVRALTPKFTLASPL